MNDIRVVTMCTLGFRWSAVNNLFLTAGDFAADEWRAGRAADEENAEREMRQFVWCLPVVPDKHDEICELLRAYPPGSNLTAVDVWPQFLEDYPDHAAALDQR